MLRAAERSPSFYRPLAFNERIEKELEGATILNLNNTIAPQGTLLNQYTTDGTHLNEAAYDAWASMVKATMAGGDLFKPGAPNIKYYKAPRR